jgi:glycosyltransferase involved in cell wall biosynthesis
VKSGEDVIPVIPAYEPGRELTEIVKALKVRFPRIVVVDDGSTRADGIFAETEAVKGVTLLRHDENRGKGAALKTAFSYILAEHRDVCGVVTVDADGQHLISDVQSVAEALARHPGRLILGTRNFRGNIPFRSRFGNIWTRWEFFLLTGVLVNDTQTGLRGIPAGWLKALCGIAGDRYDYESRMLVQGARAKMKPLQIPITTVYLNGNRSSHFRPLADTLRTQAALLGARFSRRVPF